MSKAKEVRATFNTLPKATAKQVNPILYDEATLRGEVDPSGLTTKYHFEYLTEDKYDEDGESFAGAKSTPVGKLEPTSGFVPVKAPLTGLEEGALYRFRLIAENAVGSDEDEGAFETLQRMLPQVCPNTAYRFGLSANLPDCRAYELVTPAQTDGLTPASENDGGTASGSFSNWFTVQRGARAGERLSYFTTGTLPGFEGNGRLDGYRAERGAGEHPDEGWQSALFSPGYGESAPGITHFALQHGIAPISSTPSGKATRNPKPSPKPCPTASTWTRPAASKCSGRAALASDLDALSRYVSAGGAHVIFTSRAHLEEKAPPASTQAIYDRSAGAASADGRIGPARRGLATPESRIRKRDATYVGASEDGSAIAFRVGGALYLHRNGVTVEIALASTPSPGSRKTARASSSPLPPTANRRQPSMPAIPKRAPAPALVPIRRRKSLLRGSSPWSPLTAPTPSSAPPKR